MQYQGANIPKRRIGMMIIAIIGGIIGATCPIYPFIWLIEVAIYDSRLLTVFGWLAMFGCLGEVVTSSLAASLSCLKFTTFMSIKGCLIANVVMHAVSGMVALLVFVISGWILHSILAVCALVGGLTALICLLFLYPGVDTSPYGYSPYPYPYPPNPYLPGSPYTLAPGSAIPPQFVPGPQNSDQLLRPQG